MAKVSLNEINLINLLIENYKDLKLTESEAMCFLLIYLSDLEKPSLITGELLVDKMNLDKDEIDKVIISLIDKKFVSYESDSTGGIITSPILGKDKILNHFVTRVLNEKSTEEYQYKEDELQKVLRVLQDRYARSLTPLEISKVESWFSQNIPFEVIQNAIDNIYQKNGKLLSLTKIDKEISRIISTNDIKEEGFSSVTIHDKTSIKEKMEIASYDWVHDDDR